VAQPAPPPQRPVTFSAPPEGYNALPPIRQTISIPNVTLGIMPHEVEIPAAPVVQVQSSSPPRARMPEPGSVTERVPPPTPQPRTVAPRLTSTLQGLTPNAVNEGATPRVPNIQALRQPEYQPRPQLQAEAPQQLQPPAEPAPKKPTKLVSRRDMAPEKDATERLDPILPKPAPAPAVEADEPAIAIDFSSIEAALQKPAPTGASVKIPAPTAGARPLASLASVGAEAAAIAEAPIAISPKIVTKRITAVKPAPQAVAARVPIQPAMAFADEMFSKQTMVVGAPVARPRRSADAAYPQVISKPEQAPPEPKKEILASVMYTELAKPAEEVPLVEPEFSNSLGMGFVQVPNLPIGFGIWQVRVRDFRAFSDATGYDAGPKWRSPDFLQLEDNPVIFVSWLDAIEFCKWLTVAEQEAGWIDADQFYRLPSDLEWSAAVGLRNEPGEFPAQRHGRIQGVYPWGKMWPPPPRVGNFADESAARRFGWDPVAPGYDDGHVYTAKVGSYHVSPSGVYDLSGNVWEWVEDWYDATETRRALRGSAWTSSQQAELLSCARDSDLPDARRGKNGFRVVLAAV
jgi:hypothetical protein